MELSRAEFPGRAEGTGWQSGRDADQGDAADAAHKGEIAYVAWRTFGAGIIAMLAGHIGVPETRRLGPGHGDVGVMIAGNDCDAIGRSYRFQERIGLGELVGERNID